MRMRAFVFALLSLLLSWQIVLCGASIDVSAVSGGRYMTPQEALQVFGNSIDFEYFNGTDYTTAQFLYDTTDIVYNTYGAMPDYWSDFDGATYLRYTASTVNLNTNPQYITVDIAPSYSIFNTDQITTLIALSSGSDSYSVSASFQSPSWDWVIGSDSYHYENDLLYNSYHSCLRFSNNQLATFVPMQWISQSISSGYSRRAVFSGNSGSTLYLWICCPYISADAEGSQGTFTTTSQSNIDITVDVDMSETNSLLQDIIDGLSGIWSGITGVFVPSAEYIDDWKDDIADLLDDSFGRYSEVDDLLDDVKDSIVGAAPSSDVSLPAVSIPNTSVTIPAQTWHVIPSGWSGIVDYIKFGFDILFTCLFVNTIRQRLRTIIHGETLVEVEGVD